MIVPFFLNQRILDDVVFCYLIPPFFSLSFVSFVFCAFVWQQTLAVQKHIRTGVDHDCMHSTQTASHTHREKKKE